MFRRLGLVASGWLSILIALALLQIPATAMAATGDITTTYWTTSGSLWSVRTGGIGQERLTGLTNSSGTAISGGELGTDGSRIFVATNSTKLYIFDPVAGSVETVTLGHAANSIAADADNYYYASWSDGVFKRSRSTGAETQLATNANVLNKYGFSALTLANGYVYFVVYDNGCYNAADVRPSRVYYRSSSGSGTVTELPKLMGYASSTIATTSTQVYVSKSASCGGSAGLVRLAGTDSATSTDTDTVTAAIESPRSMTISGDWLYFAEYASKKIRRVKLAADGSIDAGTLATIETATANPTGLAVLPAAAFDDARLSSLTPSSGALSPAFDSATTTYALSTNALSLTLTPTRNQANATINVETNTVSSGTPSPSIPLNIGSNVIRTVVTAEDGVTQETYTISATRYFTITYDSNTAIAGATAAETFTASTTTFAHNGFSKPGYRFQSWYSNPNGIGGTAYMSGSGSFNAISADTTLYAIWTSAGPLTFSSANFETVTAGTAESRTVTVTNSGSASSSISNNSPDGVTLSGGTCSDGLTLAPGASCTYIVNWTPAVNAVGNFSKVQRVQFSGLNDTFTVTGRVLGTVTYASNGASSGSVPVDSAKYALGQAISVLGNTGNLARSDGKVFAGWSDGTSVYQSGTSRTMSTSNVTFTAQWQDRSRLASLVPGSGSLSPGFDSTTATYSMSVDNSTTSMSFTPTAGAGVTRITVNGATVPSGNASSAVALSVGANTVQVVTSGATVSTETYTVTVSRAAPTSSGGGARTQTDSIGPAPTTPIPTGSTFDVPGTFKIFVQDISINGSSLAWGSWSQSSDGLHITLPPTAYGKLTVRINNGVEPPLPSFDIYVTPPAATLKVDANGGAAVTDIATRLGDTVAAPTAPARLGYDFLGWATVPDVSGSLIQPGAAIAVTDSTMTLYAKWSLKTTPATVSKAISAIRVYFASGSSALGASAKRALQSFAAQLASAKGSLEISGFVQATRSTNNDRSLSLARAKAVSAQLLSSGVRLAQKVIAKGVAPEAGDRARRVVVTYRTR